MDKVVKVACGWNGSIRKPASLHRLSLLPDGLVAEQLRQELFRFHDLILLN